MIMGFGNYVIDFWDFVTTAELLWMCFYIFVSAYQNNDITEFEKILRTNRENIMEDPFIREHIEGRCNYIF